MEKQIFISHASEDEKLVEYFIDEILVGAFNIPHGNISCTSVDGMKVKSGEDWRQSIRADIISSKVIFCVITPNYKVSEICQYELGASWIFGKNVLPLIVDPIKVESVGLLNETKQVENFTSSTSLDRIKDRVYELFQGELTLPKSDRWTAQKRKFRTKADMYLGKNHFKKPMGVEEIERIILDYKALQGEYETILGEKTILEDMLKELEQLKDVDNVKTIKRKFIGEDHITQFTQALDEVKQSLRQFHSVILTLIYNDYTGNDLNIDYQCYASNIAKAIANGLIDDESKIVWSNRNMNKVRIALDRLNLLMKEEVNELFEYLEETFPQVTLELDNLEFWEGVICVRMSYE